MNQLTLILLVGCSGSGKSTYAQNLLSSIKDSYLLCPDNLREEVCGDINDQSKNHFIFSTLVPIRMNGAHARHQHIVFDATNVSRKSRKSIIEHAKWLGYRVEAHVFRVPIEVCKARNASRARQIPEFVIDRQFAQYQEPELTEGLDAIVEAPHEN